MAALPYMQLYIAEYLADTAHLSGEQHGPYLLLIMNYWQRGKALPDDDGQFANITKLPLKKWRLMRGVIAEFFIQLDGHWFHKRIERDLDKIAAKSGKCRDAGLASAEARRQRKYDEIPTDVPTIVERTLERTVNENATILRAEQIRTEQSRSEARADSDLDGFDLVEIALSEAHLPQGQAANEMRTASDWINRGFTEADIRGAIRTALKRNPHFVPKSMAYFTPIIEEFRAASRPAAKAPAEELTLERQRKFLHGYREYKAWSNQCGPRPDEPDCRFDQDLLVEFGFRVKEVA